MGERTNIGWTTATYNPWRGCTKVSSGCDKCFMFREQRRYNRDPEIVTRCAPATFTAPLRWTEPRLIFTCSWSDWFHADADPWRDEAWDIIRRTPHHTYQILTKRTGRIKRHLPSDWGDGWPNVWLGATVESPDVSWRVRQLTNNPAALHFLSCEPLLGDVAPVLDLIDVEWVIGGGESDANPRVMDLRHLWNLAEKCQRAGVPMYVKQDSGKRSEQQGRIPDALWALKQMPAPAGVGTS